MTPRSDAKLKQMLARYMAEEDDDFILRKNSKAAVSL
jgi:hypothetical protein